ncbi:hypothetical protein ABPG73_009958 [Tetrahymena malaccensis]
MLSRIFIFLLFIFQFNLISQVQGQGGKNCCKCKDSSPQQPNQNECQCQNDQSYCITNENTCIDLIDDIMWNNNIAAALKKGKCFNSGQLIQENFGEFEKLKKEFLIQNINLYLHPSACYEFEYVDGVFKPNKLFIHILDKNNHFLMEDNSKLCKKAKECSSNHYFSVEINNCKNCHDSCKTCSNLKIGQKEIDSCIECAGSKKKLQITDPSSPSNSVYNCVDCDTNKGFYSDNIKCYKCQVEFCDVCLSENGSNCSKCSSGKYLLNNKCVDCDQVGYYKTEDSSLGGQCNQCSSNCKECDGPYNQKCKQCIDNYYFNENKECVTCPDELFYKLNGECKSCHQNCLKCENGNNESDCTVCKNNMYLIDGMCQTCPTSKYFEKRSTKQCLKCDDSCETCSDQRIENCTLCKDGFYFSEENGKKLCKSCDENNGFFIDSNSFCKPCHQSCITCYGQGANQCSICRHGLHLMKDSTCVECNSSNGLFVDNETQMCEKCHSTCKTCDGASQNSCLDCKEGQFLTIDRMCSECKGILWKFRKRQSQKKGEDQDQFDSDYSSKYGQSPNSSSSYFKIIASYLQILGSLSNFNISIPSFFPQTLNSFGNPIKVSIESMNFLLKNYSRGIPYHFYKYILQLKVPIWFYLIVIAIVFYIKQQKDKDYKKITCSLQLYFYLFICNMVKYNKVEYCYTFQHIAYITYLLVFSILILIFANTFQDILALTQELKNPRQNSFQVKTGFVLSPIHSLKLQLGICENERKVDYCYCPYYIQLLAQCQSLFNDKNFIELYATIYCIITSALVVLIIQQDNVNVIIKICALSTIIFINSLTLSFIILKVIINGLSKLLVQGSSLSLQFPNLAIKLQVLVKFCEKYFFKSSQFFNSSDYNEKHQSPQKNSVLNQNISSFSPQIRLANQNSIYQTSRQENQICLSSQAQQPIFLKYRSKQNSQHALKNQINVQRNSQLNTISNSNKFVKKTNIATNQNSPNQNTQNQNSISSNTQKQNQQILLSKQFNSEYQDYKILEEKKQENQIISPYSKPLLVDQRFSSFKNLKSPRLNKIDESDTISRFENDREFFILSERDLDKNQSQIHQIYQTNIQQLNLK